MGSVNDLIGSLPDVFSVSTTGSFGNPDDGLGHRGCRGKRFSIHYWIVR